MTGLDPGDTKVANLDVTVVGDHDVARLHVAVDHSVLVGIVQRLGHGNKDLQGVEHLHGTLRFRDYLIQRRTGNVLEDQIIDTLMFGDIVDSGDSGMVQTGGCLSLTKKSFLGFRVRDQLLRENLDGHRAVEQRVVAVIDDAHAATAKLFDDVVATDCGVDHRVLILRLVHSRLGQWNLPSFHGRRVVSDG